MNNQKNKFLKSHFPELFERTSLPANYQFAQLFTLSNIGENGSGDLSNLDALNIKVHDYQTDIYPLMNTLGKPISKIVR